MITFLAFGTTYSLSLFSGFSQLMNPFDMTSNEEMVSNQVFKDQSFVGKTFRNCTFTRGNISNCKFYDCTLNGTTVSDSDFYSSSKLYSVLPATNCTFHAPDWHDNTHIISGSRIVSATVYYANISGNSMIQNSTLYNGIITDGCWGHESLLFYTNITSGTFNSCQMNECIVMQSNIKIERSSFNLTRFYGCLSNGLYCEFSKNNVDLFQCPQEDQCKVWSPPPDPTPRPSVSSSPDPSPEPTPEPTLEPTPEATNEPTAAPTAKPTPEATDTPTIIEILTDITKETQSMAPTRNTTEAPKPEHSDNVNDGLNGGIVNEEVGEGPGLVVYIGSAIGGLAFIVILIAIAIYFVKGHKNEASEESLTPQEIHIEENNLSMNNTMYGMSQEDDPFRKDFTDSDGGSEYFVNGSSNV